MDAMEGKWKALIGGDIGKHSKEAPVKYQDFQICYKSKLVVI